MRTAVIADVHANMAALEAVLEDIDRERAEEILCLGDIIGYGPDPEEVIHTLRRRQAVIILGNHEYALGNPGYFKRLNPDPKASLEINRRLMSPESIAFAVNLPPVLLHNGVRLVHGCPPRSPTCYLFYPSEKMLEKLFTSYPERLCFHGHTHALNLFEQGSPPEKGLETELATYHLDPGRHYMINPGSVGQPRDGINRDAKYLIWDQRDRTVTFKAVQYDVMRTVRKLRRLNFPAYNSERLIEQER